MHKIVRTRTIISPAVWSCDPEMFSVNCIAKKIPALCWYAGPTLTIAYYLDSKLAIELHVKESKPVAFCGKDTTLFDH